MAEYIIEIDHPELCVEYGGTNSTDRLERIVRCKDCMKAEWCYDEYRGDKPSGLCRRTKTYICDIHGFCAWGKEEDD